MNEAKTELARIIQDREMKDALLLVFANKQDIPGGGSLPYPPYLASSSLHMLTLAIGQRCKFKKLSIS